MMMISETLLSGKMTIKIKDPITTDGLLLVLASESIGVSIAFTVDQAKNLLEQIEAKLSPKEERELVGA